MSDTPYTLLPNLADAIDIPDGGILSKPLLTTDRAKVVLFAFAPGQELSEHTANVPALLHILEGDATLTLGPDTHPAHPGTWTHMPAHLPHSILAHTPLKMLLVMLKGG
jgi:quercetin dioxygenase-like cupin family protein